MPKKKESEPTVESPEPKTPRRRSKPAAEAAAPTQTPVEKAPARSRAKRVVEPVAKAPGTLAELVEVEKKAPRPRTRTKLAEPETPSTPAAKSTPKSSPKSPAEPQAEPEAKPAAKPKAPPLFAGRTPAAAKPRPEPKAKPEAKPEPAPAASAPSAATPVAEPAKSPRRRAAAAKAEPVFAPEDPAYGDPLPVPVWRTRSAGPPPSTTEDDVDSPPDLDETAPDGLGGEGDGDESGLAPRRRRSRKRKDRRDVVPTAVVEPKPAPAEPRRGREQARRAAPQPEPVREEQVRPRTPKRPQTPELPVREPIAIPADAAQVVVRDGVPVLVRHKTVYPPVAFFANAQDEDHLATVLEEVKLASENGLHLYSLLVELDVDPRAVDQAVGFAGYLIKAVTKVDPDAQIVFRTVFVAADGWERTYPKGRYILEDGGVAEPSFCDDAFWSVAESCLESFVRKLRIVDTGGHVMGLHIERGEWFFGREAGYDTSVAATDKFRLWLRQRYRDDAVSLRASWFDGQAQFDTVAVPDEQTLSAQSEDFVRTDRKARRWVDYHLFLSDSTCERIAGLAYAVKRASEGRYLVGASYGYTFEWSHAYSGHLSLGKLLRCPDIDYIAGPPSYRNREPGGSASAPGPIDSFALNGKLFMSEEDFKTPISGRREADDFNPVMKTPQALESVHWRGVGAALAHGGGVCWMDSWGNGWLNSHGIWERGGRVHNALSWRLATPQTAPDVAVFIDERSLAYLVDPRAFETLVQEVRESVVRSGLSVGFYLLSDLAHRESFPESKLHVFVNAWDIRPEVRSAIKTRLQRDGKVLFWVYCAGLFEGGRESLERVREVTGIALRPQPFNSKSGTTILNFRDPLCQALPEKGMAAGGRLEPSYFAIPEDGRVLGEYSQTGLPSFVRRDFPGERGESWTSVFLGEPVVTPGLFRALGEAAGAHVWSLTNDVVHVRGPFLTVHCTGTAPRTVMLPERWAAYSLTTGEWMATEANSLRFHGLDGSTHSFLVGLRADVEHLLATDPAETLRLEDPLPRQDNTLHWDAMRFDVPIMKLDEWVEESWSEEMADDLLLKPSMLEVPVEVPIDDEDESAQRSRGGRRRRRRRKGGGGEEGANGRREGADRQADDLGLNVLFRKRE